MYRCIVIDLDSVDRTFYSFKVEIECIVLLAQVSNKDISCKG